MTSPIGDTTIEALAKDIFSDSTVDELGLKLGYRFEALDFYKANNHTGNKVTYQGTKQMLIDWRKKTPQEQQRSKLRKALDDVGLVRLAEIHLDDTTREAVATAEQTLKKETETQRGQQTQQQPGVTNTISASDSSNVSGNTMIGQQTNVYKSTPSAPVVHHHYTTNVKQAAPPRPVFIQQQGQKRQATTSPAPPTKRSKVTHARPSTSKATTSKRKKSKPKPTTQSKKATSKKKSQTAPNAPKKRTPKTASTKKNSQRKKQTVKKKKPPKTTKPKSKQRARSKTKPTKSKRK